MLKVTLKRSLINCTQRQKDTVRGLGLKKLNQTKVLQDTPAIRGMIHKVAHLVDSEVVAG